MATEIKMPQLSDTMDSGKIITWKKKEGDAVGRGDILAEVETDKANLEIECFQPGTLLKIAVPAGSKARVGEIIAYIGTPGEMPADSSLKAEPVREKPEAGEQPVAAAESMSALTPDLESQEEKPEEHAEEEAGQERLKISPLARKVAAERQVNLSTVKGTGPGGRIVLKDLETAALGTPKTTPAAPSAPAPSMAAAGKAEQTREAAPPPQGAKLIPLSKMRESIARRMQESFSQTPQFYVTVSIDMEQAAALQAALKEKPEYKGISLNHLIIKAAAYALSMERGVNNSMRDGQILQPDQINIGIITSVPDGLLIPVLRNTDKMALKDIVFEARAAIDRVRAGRPTSNDLSGGTFSISNMGMFDVESFTAIISPGQGAALAVSSMREEPVVKRGMIVPGLRMKATVSVDHRIIDGVMAAGFMKHFKQAMENPALMLL